MPRALANTLGLLLGLLAPAATVAKLWFVCDEANDVFKLV